MKIEFDGDFFDLVAEGDTDVSLLDLLAKALNRDNPESPACLDGNILRIQINVD